MQLRLSEYPQRIIRDTSYEAYHQVVYKYGVNTLYHQIVNILQNSTGFSINELAFKMQKERSTISPRVHELAKRGIIQENGERDSFVTKKRNLVWGLTPDWKKRVMFIQ